MIGYTVCEFTLFSLKLRSTVSLAYVILLLSGKVGVDFVSCQDEFGSFSSSIAPTSSPSAAINVGSFSDLSQTLCLHNKKE